MQTNTEQQNRANIEQLPATALLSNDTAAQFLDVAPGTLETWRTTKRYALPFIKVGRKVRYRKGDLDAFLNSRTMAGQAPEAA